MIGEGREGEVIRNRKGRKEGRKEGRKVASEDRHDNMTVKININQDKNRLR